MPHVHMRNYCDGKVKYILRSFEGKKYDRDEIQASILDSLNFLRIIMLSLIHSLD